MSDHGAVFHPVDGLDLDSVLARTPAQECACVLRVVPSRGQEVLASAHATKADGSDGRELRHLRDLTDKGVNLARQLHQIAGNLVAASSWFERAPVAPPNALRILGQLVG